MATLKTLSSALGVGIKCFHRCMATNVISRHLQVRSNIVVIATRSYIHDSLKNEDRPLVGDTSLYTDFEVSRNPEEWKAVERLLPDPVIKNPSPKAEYPSGWTPPNPPADSPYFVERTAAHMMPVYLHFKGMRGEWRNTLVRRIHGDIWQLEQELREYLKQQYPEHRQVVTKVDEVAGVIKFRGDHVNYIKRYLSDRGW